MKIFLKIVKVIAYICSFLVGLLVIKLGFQSYQLIEHSMSINDYNTGISVFFLAIILFTVGPSIIGTIVLLVYLIFLFPRSINILIH